MKKETKQEEKKIVATEGQKVDKIVLLICLVMIAAFVFILPNMNDMVRRHKEEQTNIEDKTPVTYRCKMTKTSEENGYTLDQDATYSILDKKVAKAEIHRTYQFNDLASYQEWKDENGTSSNIKGQTERFDFSEEQLKIKIDIIKDLHVMNEKDLEATFPKTYQNLLIYTKDQTCEAGYKN